MGGNEGEIQGFGLGLEVFEAARQAGGGGREGFGLLVAVHASRGPGRCSSGWLALTQPLHQGLEEHRVGFAGQGVGGLLPFCSLSFSSPRLRGG